MEFGRMGTGTRVGFVDFSFLFFFNCSPWAGLFRGPVVRGLVGLNPTCLQDKRCWDEVVELLTPSSFVLHIHSKYKFKLHVCGQ
jgi:hypothetical protein